MKNYRSTIVGFGVLIVLMTAGAAQSLSGSNTVYTDDIVNNHVTNADLGPNSVSRSKIADNAIAGPEVLDNSITGSDVDEASLAAVCPADMTRAGDICYGALRTSNSWGDALVDCANEDLRLPTVSEGVQINLHIEGTTEIWTDGVYKNQADGTYFSFVASDSGVVEVNHSLTRAYRCVTTVGARP